MHSSQEFSFSEIEEDSELSHRYTVDETVYDALVSTFNDRSPIHVDENYAKAEGFADRVMHGAILNGFLSHFVGMVFPGKRSLIASVNISYRNPFYLNDEIQLTSRVRQKVESVRTIMMDVKFSNAATDLIVATAKVQVVIRDGSQ